VLEREKRRRRERVRKQRNVDSRDTIHNFMRIYQTASDDNDDDDDVAAAAAAARRRTHACMNV
jgi:ribosomal protein S20